MIFIQYNYPTGEQFFLPETNLFSFVISSNEKVKVNLLRGPLEIAKICADGQEDIPVPYLEDIQISKMEHKLRLVHPINNDFFGKPSFPINLFLVPIK